MASSAPASNTSNTILESLPTRPPTPPRETQHQQETEVSLKTVLGRNSLDPRSSLQTPPNVHSPSSAGATKSNPRSSRMSKKVEWSAHTEYKDPPPQYREGARPHKSSPFSAPSSASSKPVKGILKPSSSPNPLASSLHSQLDGQATQGNIIEMLDSTIKQLAGSDRDSRLDAYTMLARALKISNNLPDRVALQSKMSLLTQFIQRDLTSKNADGSPDASLTNHALNLLTTFLRFQAVAASISSDFGVFIIDYCIRSFLDVNSPKDLVRHLMQVAAFQTFSPKVMTSDRVGRLVASLHGIGEHLEGKSIVTGRIYIYKQLLKQSRNQMAVHTDWLKDMFTDMLSEVKDVRAQAISLGTDAGFALRNEKQLLRKASEIFETTHDGTTYIEHYMQRLEEIIREKRCPSAVPQIWSVIILFHRFPGIEKWKYFSQWLKLAQSAFNTTDGQTKQEANYAWNRYVYLSLNTNKVSPKALGLLTQALSSQLRRKFNAKQVDEALKLRKTVIGGLCNLYYYAFRPNHDKDDKALTDTTWEIAVQPVIMQLISLDGKPEALGDSVMQASQILTGLLDATTPRSWNEDRIRDPPLVTPNELPSIDPKWTRHNSKKIFEAVAPILEKKFTDLANKESATYRLWQALVGSIAAASEKDIKVSEDTTKFFASTFGLLCKVWTIGSPGDGSMNPKFLASVKNFIDTLVKSLGLLPFTEKKLSMSVANTFEPVATPSHRPDRDSSHGIIRAPLYHLFSMLSSIPPGGADDELLSDFMQSVFEPFFIGKSTKVRVELAREMLRLLPRNTLSPYGPWILASQNMRLPLDQLQNGAGKSIPSSDRLLGAEYREAVSLLERGLTSHPNLPAEGWVSLFNVLSEHVVRECGDAGRALGVVEPIAKMLLDNFFGTADKLNQTALSVATDLFKLAKLPRDRQAVDVARRRLWGAPLTATRASSFDPFDNLYKLGNKGLVFLYETDTELGDRGTIVSCIEAVSAFVAGSFSQTGIKTAVKFHEGICPWIRDEKAHLLLRDSSPISLTLRNLWNSICQQMASLGHLDKNSFDQVEPLLTAGLKSKHRYVVSRTAEAWNAIVKDEEELECSDSLKAIITSLRPIVDLAMPGFEESSGEFGAQATSFIESQDDLSLVVLSSTKSSRHDAEKTGSLPVPTPKVALKGMMTRKRRRDATPEVAPSKPAKRKTRTSTPRLRHGNSQIQFAPIPSSSPLAKDSQHLTERQREVRQRQKQNAALYSDVRSSPRTRSQAILEESRVKEQKANGSPNVKSKRQEATPERTTSYEDFISLTPTPRRGQALQMEEDNDPPSSPPEPRRYPLLSAMQAKSNTRSSLENWEFSSPPGSPETSHQQEHHTTEPPHIVMTDDSTQYKAVEKAEADLLDEMDIIPSSAIFDEDTKGLHPSVDACESANSPGLTDKDSAVLVEAPSTPPERDIIVSDKLQETPKSGEDEFVDARSSPIQQSPTGAFVEARPASSQTRDTSFAFSEGDESSMMRLVVQLESRRCNLPFDKVNSASPEKQAIVPVKDCIIVHSDGSSSLEEEEEAGSAKKRSRSPITVPTAVEAAIDALKGSHTKRKRKRGGPKYSETRRKKRRSVDTNIPDQVDDSQPAVSESSSSPVPSARRLARKVAGLKSKKGRHSDSQSSSVGEAAQAAAKKTPVPVEPTIKRDAGDTDEEVMSQLVTEVEAASQSQSQPEADAAEANCELEDSMDLVSMSDDQVEDMTKESEKRSSGTGEQAAGASKASAVMQILRAGMNELRGASLSRQEVYELEDMLMDMKRELFEAERRGRS
ncbi:hypothetical protein G7046_g2189 [Stylonectria norvegica]|nr:hypothetical protein G7046_g2189 [Stylonectria norvegica]